MTGSTPVSSLRGRCAGAQPGGRYLEVQVWRLEPRSTSIVAKGESGCVNTKIW